MAGAAGKVKALEQWCKARTNGYRDVDVKDMARSWRSGLAFCALIHKYRPDLIDYESLSKENVLANNRLAFQTAEHELGIPALLDAEDMARLEVPDRLSIITYVAQYYNYFRDKEPAGGPGVSASIKRQRSAPTPASPEAKRHSHDAPAPAAAKAAAAGVPPKAAPLTVNAAGPGLPAAASADLCKLCGARVYLLERLIDGGQLYHRSCHRQSTGKSAVPAMSLVPSAAEVLPSRPFASAPAPAEAPVNGQVHAGVEESASAAKSAARTTVMSALASSMQPGLGRPASSIATPPGHVPTAAAAAEQNGRDGAATEVGADVFAAKLAKLRQLRQKAREAGADDSSDRLSRVTQKLLSHKGGSDQPASTPVTPTATTTWSGGTGSAGQKTADREVDATAGNIGGRPTDTAANFPVGSGAIQQQPAGSSKTSDVAVPRDGSAQQTAAAAAAAAPAVRRPVQPERPAPPTTASVATAATPVANAPPRPSAGPSSSVVKAAAEAPAKKLDKWQPSPPDVVPAAAAAAERSTVAVHSGSGTALPAKSSAGSSVAETRGLPVRPAQPPHPADVTEPDRRSVLGVAASGVAVKALEAAAAEPPASVGAASRGGGAAAVAAAAVSATVDTSAGQTPVKPSRMSKKKKQPGDTDELVPGSSAHGRPHSSITLPAGSAPPLAASVDTATDDKHYPSDLNPFGTDDNEAEPSSAAPAARSANSHGGTAAAASVVGARGAIPSAGVPLAPRSASTIASSRPAHSAYDSSLNPFGPDEADEEEGEAKHATPRGVPPSLRVLQPPAPGSSGAPATLQQQQRKKLVPDIAFDFERSDDDHAAMKKRQKAPAPARPLSLMPVVPDAAPASAAAATAPAAVAPARPALAPSSGGHSADVSPAVTPNTARKKKPAPTPPAALHLPQPTSAAAGFRPEMPLLQQQQPQPSDRQADEQQRRPTSSAVGGTAVGTGLVAAAAGLAPAAVAAADELLAQPKKSKPAPPRPMPPGRRSVASAESELGMTLFEVERELQILDQKQQQLEEQGRALEEAIRRADAVLAASERDDELLAKWLDMVNEKNRLVRRESELVYVCKQHSLEERQADIEWDLRQIMNKPECQKTDADKRLEEELLQEMITVVQERNKLVESLDEDRLRQLEEDKEIELAMNSHAASDIPAATEASSKAVGSGGAGKVKTKVKKEKKTKEKKSKAGRP